MIWEISAFSAAILDAILILSKYPMMPQGITKILILHDPIFQNQS